MKVVRMATLAGTCVALALGIHPAMTDHIQPALPGASISAAVRSTDLGDLLGVCQEDQPCWSCVDDGNRVCGPNNANHVPTGCYDDGGVLYAEWPCQPWKPADGYKRGSITYASGPNAYDDGSYVGGFN